MTIERTYSLTINKAAAVQEDRLEKTIGRFVVENMFRARQTRFGSLYRCNILSCQTIRRANRPDEDSNPKAVNGNNKTGNRLGGYVGCVLSIVVLVWIKWTRNGRRWEFRGVVLRRRRNVYESMKRASCACSGRAFRLVFQRTARVRERIIRCYLRETTTECPA